MKKFLLIVTLLVSLVTFIMLWATQGDDGGRRLTWHKTPVVDVTQPVEEEEDKADVIGGPFTLTDQLGRKRTDLDFRGRIMLVFFGFSHCPDICPVTMATFASLMDLLGDKASQVAPVFITVDPERDTPEALKTYLGNFDDRITGLTGSPHEIKEVAGQYKVFYAMQQPETHVHDAADKDTPPPPQETPVAEGDNYQVNHSGTIFLMDREGHYVQHFSYNASEQEIADALKPLLK